MEESVILDLTVKSSQGGLITERWMERHPVRFDPATREMPSAAGHHFGLGSVLHARSRIACLNSFRHQ